MTESVDSCSVASGSPATYDPFDETLGGEYARMLLVGTAACVAVSWAIRMATQPVGLVIVVANVLIVGTAVSYRLAGLPRLAMLALLALVLAVIFVVRGDVSDWQNSLTILITFAALGVLLIRDSMIAIRARSG